VRLLLLAPPGAGKGTQGKRLAAWSLLDRASQGGRSDDRADVIRHRLEVFAETTGPLVPYYKERGILVAVDADQPPESVSADIQAGLSGLPLPCSRGH
jgi:adenylate kinase family enzyme